MKRSGALMLAGMSLLIGMSQASAQHRGGSDVGTAGIEFRIAADGYQIGYLKDIFGQPLLLLTPVVGGVLVEVTAKNSEEFKIAEGLITYLQKNISRYQFQKSASGVLITIGQRHAPSLKEVYQLLENVQQIIRPQAESLGLLQSKIIIPKN